MPQYVTFASAQATTRVWNVTTGGEPSGWQDPGFDDSGWSLSSAPTVSGLAYLPTGVEAVAPWAAAAASTDTLIYRSHFTHPGGSYVPYGFEYFGAFSGEGEVFLNGNVMLGAGKVGVLTIYAPVAGDNVVAAKAVGGTVFTWANAVSGGFEAWLAWRLTMYVPDTGGQPYAWGTVTVGVNDLGFLGVGDTATHLTPTLVDTAGVMPPSVVKIVSNGKTTLYLIATGAVYGSGNNSTGLLGTGSTDASAHVSPVQINGGIWPFADVSIGDDCAMAVDRSGAVYMWGPNAHGSLGRGDTTAQNAMQQQRAIGERVLIGTDEDRYISAGRTFALVGSRGLTAFIFSAGDNTYGQLGMGSSSGDQTTWQSANFGFSARVVKMSAGDDQALLLLEDPGVSIGLYGCGRAEYGSLGEPAYTAGTGPNKIVTSLTLAFNDSLADAPYVQIAQAGPVSYLTFAGQIFDGVLLVAPFVIVLGDGVPFGGAGDGDGTIVYGQSAGPLSAGDVLVTFEHPSIGDANLYSLSMAHVSGGSHNSYAPGDSKVAHAAVLYYDAALTSPGDLVVDVAPKLYTWGWGGAGQMGSGTDPTSNLKAVWLNGLTGVVSATACASGMFAIAAAAAATRRRSRAWAQVVG